MNSMRAHFKMHTESTIIKSVKQSLNIDTGETIFDEVIRETIKEVERRLKQWPPAEALWREGVYR